MGKIYKIKYFKKVGALFALTSFLFLFASPLCQGKDGQSPMWTHECCQQKVETQDCHSQWTNIACCQKGSSPSNLPPLLVSSPSSFSKETTVLLTTAFVPVVAPILKISQNDPLGAKAPPSSGLSFLMTLLC